MPPPLALNFFPNPEDAVDEMRRIAATGGVVSACVWDYGGRMELLRHFWDSAAAVDPKARELDESRQRDALAEHLERSLPRKPDGAICLTARAWAVRGVAR